MDFQLKQAQLENERQRSEREHEMNVLRLLLSHGHVSTGPIHYASKDNWGQNYPGMSVNSMYQPCIPTHSSWTVFLFQTQMAQHLQPCNTILYSCFLREMSGYITPLLMFVYTVDNVCRLLTAAQIKFCLF